MPTSVDAWNRNFVAYEDALASFYALQDQTAMTLEQSRLLKEELVRLASLRKSIIEEKRRLRAEGDDGRVAEISRERATIVIDDTAFDVADLSADRSVRDGAVLQLGFRLDPSLTRKLVNLTAPVEIRFPFGDATLTAMFRLVNFRIVAGHFVFRFASVHPGGAG
jgi:hypothetical protein